MGALSDYEFRHKFPHPVAYPYRRMKASIDDSERWVHQLGTAEQLLHYLTIVGLAEFASSGARNGTVEKAVDSFMSKPASMGTWGMLLHSLVKGLRAVPSHALLFGDLLPCWDRPAKDSPASLLGAITQIRNRTMHGDLPRRISGEGASRLVDELRPLVHGLLDKCRPIARHPLCYLTRHRHDPLSKNGHRYFIHRCRGSDETFDGTRMQFDVQLPELQLFLLSEQGNAVLHLHPLVLHRECPHDGGRRLFLLESVSRSGEAEWLAYACGHRIREARDSDLAKLSRALLCSETDPGSLQVRRDLRVAVQAQPWGRQTSLPSLDGEEVDRRYRLLQRIGSGGMGEVFLCEHIHSRQPRALKLIRNDLSCDERMVARFERESQLSMGFAHPNLVRVFDSGEHQGRAYLVMDYVDGEDLQKRLQVIGKLEVDEAIRLVLQVVEAVAYLHAGGLVHRDIKPGNVLIGSDGVPRLADFGLVRPATPGVPLTTSTAMGTDGYMAPEQRAGTDVDARADIYSLGALLLALLTGQPPTGVTPPTGGIFDRLAPDLRKVIECCLLEDRNRRYSSVADLRAALTRAHVTAQECREEVKRLAVPEYVETVERPSPFVPGIQTKSSSEALEGTVSNPHYSSDVAAFEEDCSFSRICTTDTILAVTGCNVSAELFYRPIAELFRDSVEKMELKDGPMRVLVVTDRIWHDDDALRTYPTVAIGGIDVNSLTMEIAAGGAGLLLMGPGALVWGGSTPPRVALWGLHPRDTMQCIRTFLGDEGGWPRFLEQRQRWKAELDSGESPASMQVLLPRVPAETAWSVIAVAVPRLVDRLKKVRTEAARTVAKWAHWLDIESALSWCRSAEEERQIAGFIVMTELIRKGVLYSPHDLFEVLERSLESPSSRVRYRAVEAICASSTLRDWLEGRLQTLSSSDDNSSVRTLAARGCAES